MVHSPRQNTVFNLRRRRGSGSGWTGTGQQDILDTPSSFPSYYQPGREEAGWIGRVPNGAGVMAGVELEAAFLNRSGRRWKPFTVFLFRVVAVR